MSKAPERIWIHPDGNKWSAKPAGYGRPEVEYIRANLNFVEVIGDAEATRRIAELERERDAARGQRDTAYAEAEDAQAYIQLLERELSELKLHWDETVEMAVGMRAATPEGEG